VAHIYGSDLHARGRGERIGRRLRHVEVREAKLVEAH
jgi:hypothetical protein